jgi:hypothetical protein
MEGENGGQMSLRSRYRATIYINRVTRIRDDRWLAGPVYHKPICSAIPIHVLRRGGGSLAVWKSGCLAPGYGRYHKKDSEAMTGWGPMGRLTFSAVVYTCVWTAGGMFLRAGRV